MQEDILIYPFTDVEELDFNTYANNCGKRIEKYNGNKFALLPNEILEDGNIVENTNSDYINKTLEYLKRIAIDQTIKSYDYAVRYGIFKINDLYYGNMAWETTWSKVLNLYNKTPSLPSNFSTRLYIKNNNKYYNANIINNSQGLDNMLLALQKQQFMAYQPLRDSYLNEIKVCLNNQNLDGIKSIIKITKNNSGFGDTINEQEEIVDYA